MCTYALRLRELAPIYTTGPSHFLESRGDFLLVAVSTAEVGTTCILIVSHVTSHVTTAEPVLTGLLYGWMGGGWGPRQPSTTRLRLLTGCLRCIVYIANYRLPERVTRWEGSVR